MIIKSLTLFLAVGLATASHAAGVEIIHPWIATPPVGAPTAAGYLTIRNAGKTPEVLMKASTPAADKLQLHASTMAGGVMRMRPVDGGVTIAPGQSLTLAPGGYHFMLIRPTHPLKMGDRAPATLTFARAGAVKVIFVVEAAPTREMPMP